jgi:type IV pilus assembly protein PilB
MAGLGRKCDRIEEVLLAHKLVSAEQIAQARSLQKRTREPLDEIVVSLGLVSELHLLKALAAHEGVRPWNLAHSPPTQAALAKVPYEVRKELEILPVLLQGDLLVVATASPRETQALERIHRLTGYRVEPVLANRSRILYLLDEHENGTREVNSVDVFVQKAMSEVEARNRDDGDTDLDRSGIDTRPVVGLVNQILEDAIRMKASDIHIEPRSETVDVRYRLDGRLSKFQEFPRALLPMVAARIRIMADLDIVEFRIPQDGRMSMRSHGKEIDFRVSVLPNRHGSRITLRLLDRSMALKTLDDLGVSDHNLAMYRKLIRKPHGLFLVTGPTGSGKTTSLYAALGELVDESLNIMTCEDPIEYDMHGINQSQSNDKVGLTFAAQLRSILRQDPDVVLVGEIRDQETAEIAIRAAMTGHLVLSTLHTNDAPSAIPRLIDMGVKPYLAASSLIGVFAQRLVRRLCPHCKNQRTVSQYESDILQRTTGQSGPHHIWKPVGCAECFGTGFHGRTAVSEMLPISTHMQSQILNDFAPELIRLEGEKLGYRPIQFDAMMRVLQGETSFEEAARMVFVDDITPQSADLRVA